MVRLAKGAGLVSAVAAFVGFSLSALYTQETVSLVPSAEVSQAMHPAMAQADENAAAAQAEAATGQVEPGTYLVMGDLKMTDRLGQKESAE